MEVSAGPGLDISTLHAVLRSLDGTRDLEAICTSHDVGPDGLATAATVVEHLVPYGHVRWAGPRDQGSDADAAPSSPTSADVADTAADTPIRPIRRVLVVGGGQLGQALRDPLRAQGCAVRSITTPGLALDPGRPPWRSATQRADLVILADSIVVDPVVTGALVADRMPHLHVHARDGRVVVGPTVDPGLTCCLRCMHLYRAERDEHWPQVAAQLMDTSCVAPTTAVSAAVALVLAEIAVTRGGVGRSHTRGATVEISPHEGLWRRRTWPRHPDCGCAVSSKVGALE